MIVIFGKQDISDSKKNLLCKNVLSLINIRQWCSTCDWFFKILQWKIVHFKQCSKIGASKLTQL